MQDIFEKNAPEALELGMQELEAMEAPGFWSNFKDGVVVSVAASAVYGGVASAVAVT
ncbi:daptide-type RiPP [Streptomyces mutabilis]|jgi:hypothetical protein|uniref:daptide-type RiPP n=1 Tax=Streptomyces TaxID=1883 RepID=UPI0015C7D31B|nr:MULTISPECIES: daptide-type RiPP [unclassified Streptomyces]MDG9694083.1 hypothetical protein [Streptomyces sp. DH17]MDN3246973.1 daptide-type RiPP [Streptomyces sp. ZSW22]MDN3254770.1 daptide-type RiPP [Streptomyces sp. MA25(2023)]MDQ0386400.1 hypothetical protein [Streptomyces sp. DSM 42143]